MFKSQYLRIVILELIILIASLSCQSAAQTTRLTGAAGRPLQINKLQFPQQWLEQTRIGLQPLDGIEDLEVRQVPSGKATEFFFAALPNGAFDYAHELNPNIPQPKYSENFSAIDFADGKVRPLPHDDQISRQNVSEGRQVLGKGVAIASW
jgi:hypothetical protein